MSRGLSGHLVSASYWLWVETGHAVPRMARPRGRRRRHRPSSTTNSVRSRPGWIGERAASVAGDPHWSHDTRQESGRKSGARTAARQSSAAAAPTRLGFVTTGPMLRRTEPTRRATGRWARFRGALWGPGGAGDPPETRLKATMRTRGTLLCRCPACEAGRPLPLDSASAAVFLENSPGFRRSNAAAVTAAAAAMAASAAGEWAGDAAALVATESAPAGTHRLHVFSRGKTARPKRRWGIRVRSATAKSAAVSADGKVSLHKGKNVKTTKSGKRWFRTRRGDGKGAEAGGRRANADRKRQETAPRKRQWGKLSSKSKTSAVKESKERYCDHPECNRAQKKPVKKRGLTAGWPSRVLHHGRVYRRAPFELPTEEISGVASAGPSEASSECSGRPEVPGKPPARRCWLSRCLRRSWARSSLDSTSTEPAGEGAGFLRSTLLSGTLRVKGGKRRRRRQSQQPRRHNQQQY